MKRIIGAGMAVVLALSGCGDDDGDDQAVKSTTSTTVPPEETTTTEAGPPVDRSRWRETETATAEIDIDGETSEVTEVTCRALGPTNSMKWIVQGGSEALVAVESAHESELPEGEATELTDMRIVRLTVEGTTYEMIENTTLADPTGSVTVTVTDSGRSAIIEIEGETDDGTSITASIDCADMTLRDDDGEPIDDDGGTETESESESEFGTESESETESGSITGTESETETDSETENE